MGIITALPEERRAVLTTARVLRRETIQGLCIHDALLAGRPICVMEGGMGGAAAGRAAQLLIDARQPRLLLSAGFCGAVRPGPAVGDTVLCCQVLTVTAEGLKDQHYSGIDEDGVIAALNHGGLTAKGGSFITATAILSKPELARRLPPDLPTPVLEMESAAVAAAALTAHLPFLGIRTVSDDAAEELLFSLDDLATDNRISIPKVLLACLKTPRIVPQLARLARNSAVAGKNLAHACRQVIPLLDNY